jgi:hypothetical protein
MRLVVLFVSLALVAGAMAEDKPKPKSTVKQLDKSSPLMTSGNAGDDSADQTENQTRAQDYNSSRSNTTSAVGDRADDLGKETRCSVGRLDCDDDGDSVPTDERCGNGVDDDCDSVDERAAPANHNTTRSNRIQPQNDRGNDTIVRKKPGKN